MRIWILPLLMLHLLCSFARLSHAQSGVIAIDPAQDRIDITTGFHGATLSVYGVTKSEGDVAITLSGPERSAVVRRKSRILGAWINASAVEFRRVPVFYDYALSAPGLEDVIRGLTAREGISLDSLNFSPETQEDPQTINRFREALIRNKQAQGLFPLKPEPVVFPAERFFKASFFLPSNVPMGEYVLSAYLIREGTLAGMATSTLQVAQEGFSARIYRFAYSRPAVYGILASALAFLIGWGATVVLRRD